MNQSISYDEALSRLLELAPLGREHSVRMEDACGCFLSQDVQAVCDVPPFDRSPLDGYAVRSQDVESASQEHPVTLKVIGKCCAGDFFVMPVGESQAVRIMTGAPVPPGADCVIWQESTDYGEETVTVYRGAGHLQNICFRGEDTAAGSLLFPAGTRLTAAHIGVLAGQGICEVSVYQPVTVGVLATGSELSAPGSSLQPGKIYNSNGCLLQARLRELGFSCVQCSIQSDDPALLKQSVEELFQTCDAVITTGGVSVGQKDYMPEVAQALGAEMLFCGVKMKPGSPIFVARKDGRLLVCLSGNPFAAAATFELLAKPALLRLAGAADPSPVCLSAPLKTPFRKASGGRRFARAVLADGGVSTVENNSSGSLVSFAGCNCFIDIAPGTPPLPEGSPVRVILL